MSWAVLSPVLIVSAALVFIGLERLFPYDPRQRLFREGFFTDLVGYGLVQSYLLGLGITALILWIDASTGVSRLRLVSDWHPGVQLLFFFVVHDFYIYCFHRLQHHVSFLWRIHEAHHSTDDVDWLSGTRSHSLEILVNQTVEFMPIVLLGAAPEVALMKATLDAVWGMYIHSNLDVRMRFLQYVLNGPEMHRWHHARDLAPPGKNFATKLAVWDWLFGTAYLPPSKPALYGLADAGYPKSGAFAWVRQHVHAFTERPSSEAPKA
jgi:sterol desaturase/sphingolipid hydroxylase (fatty acid hydroxylase superfamily)